MVFVKMFIIPGPQEMATREWRSGHPTGVAGEIAGVEDPGPVRSKLPRPVLLICENKKKDFIIIHQILIL